MLSRNQTLFYIALFCAGVYAMVKLMLWAATWNMWQWLASGELFAYLGAGLIVYVFWFAPGKLDENRQEEQRLRDEEDLKRHVARKREAHMEHLKFMAEKQNPPKQTKPIETYKFINDLN